MTRGSCRHQKEQVQGRVLRCEVLTGKPYESSGILHLETRRVGDWEGVGCLHRLEEKSSGREHSFNPCGHKGPKNNG